MQTVAKAEFNYYTLAYFNISCKIKLMEISSRWTSLTNNQVIVELALIKGNFLSPVLTRGEN